MATTKELALTKGHAPEVLRGGAALEGVVCVGWHKWSLVGFLLVSPRNVEARGAWGRTASWRVRKAGSEISAETPSKIYAVFF